MQLQITRTANKASGQEIKQSAKATQDHCRLHLLSEPRTISPYLHIQRNAVQEHGLHRLNVVQYASSTKHTAFPSNMSQNKKNPSATLRKSESQ